MAKRALITGITGQDGALLARLLLSKGYDVVGTSRDANVARLRNLQRLGIAEHVKLISLSPVDFRSVLAAIQKEKPDEIYHLAGQSSVGLSFEQPMETYESVTVGTLNFLEAIRFMGTGMKFYHAASSECYGDRSASPAREESPFYPRSPYAVAKAAAYWTTVNYREAYGIFAANGILFNHESPLRPDRFVTKKIVAGARAIREGKARELVIGNVDIIRDWGWAPEYVEAMWRMLQHERADDFIIATGESYSLREFIDEVFRAFGLSYQEHVRIDSALFRPSDLAVSRADPSKAGRVLGWSAQKKMRDVVGLMIEDSL